MAEAIKEAGEEKGQVWKRPQMDKTLPGTEVKRPTGARARDGVVSEGEALVERSGMVAGSREQFQQIVPPPIVQDHQPEMLMDIYGESVGSKEQAPMQENALPAVQLPGNSRISSGSPSRGGTLAIPSDWHKPGIGCAQHFIQKLPDPQHQIRLEAIMENDGVNEEVAFLTFVVAAFETRDLNPMAFIEDAMALAGTQRVYGRSQVKECPICHLDFVPDRGGQVFCCNADGARAQGLAPTVDHSPKCKAIGR